MMPRGVYHQAARRWPHMFTTLAPTYMGIAIAAYDFTVSYLRGEAPGTPPVKRRMYPTKQIAVAEMFVRLEQTRALFLRMAALSQEGRMEPFLTELSRDDELDEHTKGTVAELAQDQAFLLAVADYLRTTHRVH